MCVCVWCVGVERKEGGRDLKSGNLTVLRGILKNPQVRIQRLQIRIKVARMEAKGHM